MSSKQTAAERVGASASFGEIRRLSDRGQAIAEVTGEGPTDEGASPPQPLVALLRDLAHNPFNPREELSALEEAADSLRERGQLQPLAVVRRAAFLAVHPDQEEDLGSASYVVIDGNRRLAAAELAELPSLRIDVNDALASSASDLLESALVANIHREDMPPLDQAKAIQQLLDTHGSQSKVAKRLSKTEGWVSQRLSLLKLAPELQEKVETGELKVRDGRRIGRMPAEQQHEEARVAISKASEPRRKRTKADSKVATAAAGPLTAGSLPSECDALEAAKAPGTETAPLPSQSRHADPNSVHTHSLYPVKTADTVAEVPSGTRELTPADDAYWLVDSRKQPKVPWQDPYELADLVVEKMEDPEQRETLVAQLFGKLTRSRQEAVLEQLMAELSAE
ncbi:ParB/RepB/Spo0J family partition protein [Streptomyces sp. NRRL S-87]|uniref:ParB/RepB/Spo0J family partition protein n=1 Tax=Streptomyces sp. NRRL S-87 TaxID=1463920 RepID=UPI00068B7EF4|nr:ParB/RepB/Spo0J family partition protein [Streptomyces sp. NRRL S-87]